MPLNRYTAVGIAAGHMRLSRAISHPRPLQQITSHEELAMSTDLILLFVATRLCLQRCNASLLCRSDGSLPND
jgi:hypothetical protein